MLKNKIENGIISGILVVQYYKEMILMDLKEYVDFDALWQLQENFALSTGLSAVTLDAKGNSLTSVSNSCAFAVKYDKLCKEDDVKYILNENNLKVYYNSTGLLEFSCDLYIEADKVATFSGGQVFTKKASDDELLGMAKSLRINPDDFVLNAKAVPVVAEQTVINAAKLASVAFTQFINMAYIKSFSSHRMSILHSEITSSLDTVATIDKRTKELEAIASKQNMLTLNATIEAARAGDAGVGFAVVAKHMGELSRKSSEIYKDIKSASDTISKSINIMNDSLSK